MDDLFTAGPLARLAKLGALNGVRALVRGPGLKGEERWFIQFPHGGVHAVDDHGNVRSAFGTHEFHRIDDNYIFYP